MLLKSKKGLETHIVVLFVFSIFIAMLLHFVIALLYGNQHSECSELFIEVVEKSRDKQTIRFSLEARGETNYILKEYLEQGVFKIENNEKKRNTVRKKGSAITIIPVIVGTDQIYECREKTVKINLKTLI